MFSCVKYNRIICVCSVTNRLQVIPVLCTGCSPRCVVLDDSFSVYLGSGHAVWVCEGRIPCCMPRCVIAKLTSVGHYSPCRRIHDSMFPARKVSIHHKSISSGVARRLHFHRRTNQPFSHYFSSIQSIVSLYSHSK